jgi:hypothetical protein
LVTFG